MHDKVQPFPYAEVKEIVVGELNVRISKAFSRFDETPMAAASLGQVHSAALRDGREVVVKVQRPNIAKQIAEDFEILAQMAEFLEAHTEFGRRRRLREMLEEFRLTIKNELNYEREAQNLVAMGENMAEFGLIQVPQPVADYSTRRILTMDYVRGGKITKLGPLARLELDGMALAEELFRAYLKQVLVDGRIPATCFSPTRAASHCSTSVWSDMLRPACRTICSTCSLRSARARATTRRTSSWP